jgi:hypothetical protein
VEPTLVVAEMCPSGPLRTAPFDLVSQGGPRLIRFGG